MPLPTLSFASVPHPLSAIARERDGAFVSLLGLLVLPAAVDPYDLGLRNTVSEI